MGIMDMVGGLLGNKKTGNALVDAVLPMLAGGGLGGLLGKFQSAGLGQKASSWVATGANETVSPDEVHQALGDDTIGQLAQQTGMSHEAVKGGLASMLPGLIDQLTPGGSVPAGGLGKIGSLAKGLDLGKLFG
jgi:uncharacterized protein YidB (DUF937 family)